MLSRTKTLTTLAMLSAIAFFSTWLGRVPVVLFLKYDPKDVVIMIGGFLYGPMAAFMMSFAVSFIEMLTISETGVIGLVMNIISSCSFCCTAAFVYKKIHSIKGAVAGLVFGCFLMTAVMLLWNYAIAPIYMGIPRQVVAGMLIPAFLPFNLIKSGLNAAISMLVYKPVSAALGKSGLMPIPEGAGRPAKLNLGVVLASAFVIISCVLVILVFQNRI